MFCPAAPAGRTELGQSVVPAVVRKHIMSCQDLQLPSELAALAINLTVGRHPVQNMKTVDDVNRFFCFIRRLHSVEQLGYT